VRRLGRRGFLAVAFGAVAASACGAPDGAGGRRAGGLLARPDRDEWPEAFWRSPAAAQTAYRYAIGHRDELRYVPCYCACGADGHRSNWDCYVDELRPGGEVLLDDHGFG
jgi:hypothetical protein